MLQKKSEMNFVPTWEMKPSECSDTYYVWLQSFYLLEKFQKKMQKICLVMST